MSNFKNHRVNEDEILSSQSSDEKMDTGSESLRSTENTPNSVLSSDFEEKDQSADQNNVLRLQNPENRDTNRKSVTNGVLRLSKPESNDNAPTLKTDLNDSLITKMSHLNINSSVTENCQGRPRNLGISPPKFSSTLTLTTSHPLMGLASPDEYPDVIPKKLHKIEDEKDISLSSTEEERPLNETNGYNFYSPQENTSKNNLYFTENFLTAESQILHDSSIKSPPDVAKVEQKIERRKIIPRFTESVKKEIPVTPKRVLGRIVDSQRDDRAITKYVEERNMRVSSQSTPKLEYNNGVDIPNIEQFHSGVAEWCDSPSQLRSMPNFELPIEMSTSVVVNNDLESPDVMSSSTQEDRSAYQALLDPYTGSVALRHRPVTSPSGPRRRIQLPPEEDACSLDSVSACSMESEEEPPEPDHVAQENGEQHSEDESTKRSTNTMSECSDPIPEYSAAEEYHDERSWMTVARADGKHAVCDMKVIEPYKRVLSHGGYDADGAAIIVFSACHLPDNSRADYRYVMDNLFLYVIWTLERLVTDDYILVYLHGSAGRRRLPTFHWLHECYKLIDRRLRKSLKHLYLVHPTFWLKSFVIITKPFVSSKFFRKLSYVRSLSELMEKVPVEPNAIPELVKEYDATRR